MIFKCIRDFLFYPWVMGQWKIHFQGDFNINFFPFPRIFNQFFSNLVRRYLEEVLSNFSKFFGPPVRPSHRLWKLWGTGRTPFQSWKLEKNFLHVLRVCYTCHTIFFFEFFEMMPSSPNRKYLVVIFFSLEKWIPFEIVQKFRAAVQLTKNLILRCKNRKFFDQHGNNLRNLGIKMLAAL